MGENIFVLKSIKYFLSFSNPQFLPNKVVVKMNEIIHVTQDLIH